VFAAGSLGVYFKALMLASANLNTFSWLKSRLTSRDDLFRIFIHLLLDPDRTEGKLKFFMTMVMRLSEFSDLDDDRMMTFESMVACGSGSGIIQSTFCTKPWVQKSIKFYILFAEIQLDLLWQYSRSFSSHPFRNSSKISTKPSTIGFGEILSRALFI